MAEKCVKCNGRGYPWVDDSDAYAAMAEVRGDVIPCDACGGTGEIPSYEELKEENRRLQNLVVNVQGKLTKAEAAVQTITQTMVQQLASIFESRAIQYRKRASETNMRRDKLYGDCYGEMVSILRQAFGLEVKKAGGQ